MSGKKSIITDREDCYLCRKWGTEDNPLDTHHCLYGNKRAAADKYGLTVKLCRECHDKVHNGDVSGEYLKRLAQYTFEEKVGTREEFRQIFGRSYLSWKERT